MTFPEIADVLGLYQRVLTLGACEYFQQQSGPRVRRGLYSAPVVLWLMIRQRLQASGTLATAVQMLIQGGAGSLLPDCLRARQEKISPSTGGYAQARRRLPALLFRQVMRELTEKLRVLLEPESTEPRAYLLDGSSLELDHSPALAQQYPPAKHQHGTSHWPVLKLAVLHELQSGLAEEPHWGPMFGPRAVSEQALAQQALDRLPAGSVVVGDRNFGVLWVVAAAQQRQLCPLVRLTEVRAKKLMAGPIAQEGDFPIVWKASRWDGGKARLASPGYAGDRAADRGADRARQGQTVVVSIHHAGLVRGTDRGLVWEALEHRTRFAFPEANRSAPSRGRQKQ